VIALGKFSMARFSCKKNQAVQSRYLSINASIPNGILGQSPKKDSVYAVDELTVTTA
jgi:hypothetical protein